MSKWRADLRGKIRDDEPLHFRGGPPPGRFLLVTTLRNTLLQAVAGFLLAFLTSPMPGVSGVTMTGPLGRVTFATEVGEPAVTVPFSLLLAAAAVLAAVEGRNEAFALTDDRLLARSGLLRGEVTVVPLEEIDGVSVETGLLDRLAGTGSLVVDHRDGRRTVLEVVPEPARVHGAIQEVVPGRQSGPPAPADEAGSG